MKKMKLSELQQKRVQQLRIYLAEVKDVERKDFDEWFKGKKQFCENVGAYLLLIEDDG